MDVPLEHLSYWLKGQPADNADYQVGTNHLLSEFSYPLDGSMWTADYLSYHADNSMPENILLKNKSTSQTPKKFVWMNGRSNENTSLFNRTFNFSWKA